MNFISMRTQSSLNENSVVYDKNSEISIIYLSEAAGALKEKKLILSTSFSA
jgi:hypothetical protein